MSAAFTPGPHEAEPSDHLGAHAYAIKASDGDYLAVGCTLWDAYLFAAAPDLYEAVHAFMERIDGGDRADTDYVISLMERALAKARGEQ